MHLWLEQSNIGGRVIWGVSFSAVDVGGVIKYHTAME
jgi:hypothetical protein